MKTKKQYNKPQITQVKLVIQNPVLANCSSIDQNNPYGICMTPGAPCADIT